MSSILFSAGDPSGDAHAADLIQALRRRDPSLSFAGLGGPAMRGAGMELLEDLTAAAAIGPFDAAKHLSVLLRARRKFAQHLSEQRPDLVVLVDFGDFHLPFIAPLAKAAKVRVVYYISPQIWAWGRWRLAKVRASVDRMVVFFPFEEKFYQQAGVPVTWVGHPLIDHAQPTIDAESARKRWSLNPVRMTVGLLPGSRESEIRRILPILLDTAGRIDHAMPGVQFILPVAAGLTPRAFSSLLKKPRLTIRLSEGPLANALQLMDAAIVCSGTATLETALCQVPMAVVYRTSWPTYWAAKLVIRIPSIALVNVVAGEPIVPEFIQHEARPKQLAQAIVELLRDANKHRQMTEALGEIRKRLGSPGAADRAAEVVMEELRRKSAGVS